MLRVACAMTRASALASPHPSPRRRTRAGPILPNFWFGLVLSAVAAAAAAVLSLAASPRAATAVEAAAEYKSRKVCSEMQPRCSRDSGRRVAR